MPISGLVLSLSEQHSLREHALEALRHEPRIEIGARDSLRVAIVCDTACGEEDKQLWNWLQQLPGIVFVDVVMVGFDDDSTSNEINTDPSSGAARSAPQVATRNHCQ